MTREKQRYQNRYPGGFAVGYADKLTRGVDNRVLLKKLKEKPMPFDTKGLLIEGRM